MAVCVPETKFCTLKRTTCGMLYWGAGGAASVAVVALPESMESDADMPCGPAWST